MPEFQMPFESNEDATEFKNLDSFTQGYVEALFWTECNSDNEELEDKCFSDLAPGTLQEIIKDCKDFQETNKVLLGAAYTMSYNEEQAGHDYWLTRNGHGAGFWDRGIGGIGEKLSEACRYTEVCVYAGDDGKVYI